MLLSGSWLVVTAVVFSAMNGIVHPYYTVALAPAVAAGIAVGAPMLWQHRNDVRAATTLAGTVLVSTVLAWVLLAIGFSFDGLSAMGLRISGSLRSLWVVGLAMMLAAV